MSSLCFQRKRARLTAGFARAYRAEFGRRCCQIHEIYLLWTWLKTNYLLLEAKSWYYNEMLALARYHYEENGAIV